MLLGVTKTTVDSFLELYKIFHARLYYGKELLEPLIIKLQVLVVHREAVLGFLLVYHHIVFEKVTFMEVAVHMRKF